MALGVTPALAATTSNDASSVPTAVGQTDPVDPPLYTATANGHTVRVNVVTKARADLSGAASTGTTVQGFNRLPIVTLRVDKSGLNALAAQPGVVSVTEDTLSAPTLDHSVPFIGADKAITAGKNGKGSAIAILDTGVATNHPFFKGKVIAEACFSTVDPANGATSLCPGGTTKAEGPGTANSQIGPCSTIAECDHGTHVAGIAVGDGSGIAGAPAGGVAPGADLIAIQVYSRFDSEQYCGAGNTPCVRSFASAQVAALEKVWELRQAGTPVIAANLSLGGGQYGSPCAGDVRKVAIDNLLGVGVATVVAAGNNGFPTKVSSPGCVASAVTVGSTGLDDVVSDFSNAGPLVDLFAPGDAIVSSVPVGGFAAKNGTSMAAPHVAGAFAVLRQTYPAKSVAELEALLKTSGAPVVNGAGTTPRVDVGKALAGAEPTPAPEPQPKPRTSYLTNDTDFAIPDPGTVLSPVTVAGFPAGPAPKALQARVNVTHAFRGEVRIDLVAPDGKSYLLKATDGVQPGGTIATTYTVNASASPLAGTWSLRVEDRSKGGSGVLRDWSLIIPTPFVKTAAVPIPDPGTATSEITVDGIAGRASRNLQVQLDVTHEWVGDLRIDLVAPDGALYPIRSTSGTDDALHPVYAVDAGASPANGAWRLRVQDTSSGAVGTLNGWALTFPSYETQSVVAIPDFGGLSSPITIGPIAGNTSNNPTVWVDITHEWLGDVEITLLAPDGTAYLLKGDAENEAGGTLRHVYEVDGRISPVAGTWNLRVEDVSTGSTGTLNAWTLTL
ncbi:proprotein convertase P-domain-containing protein [Streptomyces sp. NPDC058623]|uniref:proprotein convertase P-domain-containing protein n=1 Tax=Streptomyces sp. NPDC058623 TaxID=3346563 RepID=UPI00364F5EBF